MNNRIDAIYARQSVDKKDSLSIESQIEFCKYELKGGNCKEYTDQGYSGKNTDLSLIHIVEAIQVMEKFCRHIRSVYKELHADHETGAADNK